MTQTTREAPAAPAIEVCIAPKLLASCCLCGLIRDETGSPSDLARWITQQTYHETHGVNPTDLPLTHTYCPECFKKVHDMVRQCFRRIGTPP